MRAGRRRSGPALALCVDRACPDLYIGNISVLTFLLLFASRQKVRGKNIKCFNTFSHYSKSTFILSKLTFSLSSRETSLLSYISTAGTPGQVYAFLYHALRRITKVVTIKDFLRLVHGYSMLSPLRGFLP
ncbi:hypothetical protein Belba_0581 [Belliella baltica DSM 15883]|uniref:Uncharacterized protein n=1 Tax=Belliella baltica (strain DSM 15883 / CIP 108006 / LMG 21964 / BA134) TaxID=866536 RepID=I3Z1X0_BELBD|nr:hypothetical protein Belba_0581 [Belliella baltica DSM 15883]